MMINRREAMRTGAAAVVATAVPAIAMALEPDMNEPERREPEHVDADVDSAGRFDEFLLGIMHNAFRTIARENFVIHPAAIRIDSSPSSLIQAPVWRGERRVGGSADARAISEPGLLKARKVVFPLPGPEEGLDDGSAVAILRQRFESAGRTLLGEMERDVVGLIEAHGRRCSVDECEEAILDRQGRAVRDLNPDSRELFVLDTGTVAHFLAKQPAFIRVSDRVGSDSSEFVDPDFGWCTVLSTKATRVTAFRPADYLLSVRSPDLTKLGGVGREAGARIVALGVLGGMGQDGSDLAFEPISLPAGFTLWRHEGSNEVNVGVTWEARHNGTWSEA